VPGLLEPRTASGSPLLERALVALAAAGLLHLVYFRDGTLIYLFNPNGAGLWIDEAYRVRAGEVMYRDFFEFVPPGIVYVNAAVMALCGAAIAPFGYLGLALGTLSTALIHALASRLTGARWRLLPPALYVSIVYASDEIGDHKAFPPLFGVIALLMLVRRSRSPARLCAAGACAGLASLFTTDMGLGVALGLCGGLALDRVGVRGLLAFGLGFLVPTVLVMGWFAAQAGVATLVYDTILFPLTRYRNANPFVVFVDLGEGPLAVRTVARLVLGLGGLASALAMFTHRRAVAVDRPGKGTHRFGETRMVACAGLGLAVGLLHRAVYPLRLASAAALLLLVLTVVLESLSEWTGIARWTSRVGLVLLVFGSGWSAVGLVYRRQWERAYTRETHRAGTILVPAPLPELAWIERNTRAGESVFMLPSKGGLHFLGQTRNATSFSRLELGGLNPPEHVSQALAEIEARKPAIGVLQEVATLPSFLDKSGLEALYTGIRRSYKCEDRTPTGVLLLRRRSPNEAARRDAC
jgi:hypothetical protein